MPEEIAVPKPVLQVVFDTAVQSMDFGSGMLDKEEVDALRACAVLLGVDPRLATPVNVVCQYERQHEWRYRDPWGGAVTGTKYPGDWQCARCRVRLDNAEDDPPSAALGFD